MLQELHSSIHLMMNFVRSKHVEVTFIKVISSVLSREELVGE
jgi:hypothetical protein